MTRSAPSGQATGPDDLPREFSLLQHLAGVIRHPRSTFERAVADPRWGGLLLLTTLASAVAGMALMATEVGRLALVDQWERTALAFGQQIDPATYARFLALSNQAGLAYAVVGALLSGPVLAAGIAAIVTVACRRASFKQAMTVTTHAGVVLALRQVIAAPLGYVRESTTNAMSLGTFFPGLDEAGLVARFLGAIDVFVLWWIVVLAIGVGVLVQRRAAPLAGAFVTGYAALAVMLALALALAGGVA